MKKGWIICVGVIVLIFVLVIVFYHKLGYSSNKEEFIIRKRLK